jgi:threonine/homoserine/homoserine lactone efflux protein
MPSTASIGIALQAFVFGATLAATIGPIALLIIRIAAADGLGHGIRASLGAAVADLTFALAAFTGGYALTSALESQRALLSAMGSMVLVIFGLWMALQALRSRVRPGASASRALGGPFVQTFALTIVNPLGVILFMSLAVQLPAVSSWTAVAALCVCVFAGSLVVQAGLALGGSLLARLSDDGRWLRTLNLLSGLGITAFGVAGLVA